MLAGGTMTGGEMRAGPMGVPLYDRLMQGVDGSGARFDAHVVASMIAVAALEAVALVDAIGLSASELEEMTVALLPAAMSVLIFANKRVASERSPDEACLLDLLKQGATAHTPFQYRLAAMIARRAQRPNHLWQDLGLRNRGELSELMKQHFRPLARRNNQDMKWKKFLYRMICADAAYALCAAPSCGECNDFDLCFGEESGEALLARTRRSAEASG